MTNMKKFISDKSLPGQNSIDLRQEIAYILAQHGSWGLLRKPVRDRKCFCWNSQTAEARSDCKSCLGSGLAFVDHPVRYRKTVANLAVEVPMEQGRADGGTIFKLYLQSFVKPDREDFFAEISQDEDSLVRNFQIQPNVPLSVTHLWDLQSINDLREAGGRLEFFTCLIELADLGDLS